MDKVCENHEPLIITRQGRQSVVLLSLEDYESLDETAYLKRSPENERLINQAIKDLNEGKGVLVELDDLLN